MIELRLELNVYAPEGSKKRVRRVQPSEQSSSTGYSAYGDDGDVTLGRPNLPRKRTPLPEDTYEFGVVRIREIEL